MNIKKLIKENSTFRKIFQEEVARAKTIIKEYDWEVKQALLYARGILGMVFNDAVLYTNAEDVRNMVAQRLNQTTTDRDSLRDALFKYAQDNPGEMQNFNIDVRNALNLKHKEYGERKTNQDINPRDLPSGAPSKNRDWRGGMWTGD